MDKDTIQLYVAIINNSMSRRQMTNVVMNEEEFLFIKDLMVTVKEFNALQRYMYSTALRNAKKDAKKEIKQD